MTSRDRFIVGALSLLALFIWIRDLSWISAASDTFPLLVALPLFCWLGTPWRFRPMELRLAPGVLALSVAGFLLGGATGMTLFFSLGWTALLWSWLSVRLEPESLRRALRLLILPVMAFPWIVLDGEALGWWFRLSGSWVAGTFISMLGFDVVQEGTRLLVQGLPIEVSAACSGMNTLQSMLIAGSALAYMILGNRPAYWFNLPLLVVAAWMANTLRIFAICLAVLFVSPAFASGAFHEWGGWAVLILMFLLCAVAFSLQTRLPLHVKECDG